MVEHYLDTVGVVGSIPIAPTKFPRNSRFAKQRPGFFFADKDERACSCSSLRAVEQRCCISSVRWPESRPPSALPTAGELVRAERRAELGEELARAVDIAVVIERRRRSTSPD